MQLTLQIDVEQEVELAAASMMDFHQTDIAVGGMTEKQEKALLKVIRMYCTPEQWELFTGEEVE